MPSGRHRDFFPRQTGRQTPFRESIRARDSTESPCPRFPPRACFFADPRPQSSANKEQRLKIYESKNLRDTDIVFGEADPPFASAPRWNALSSTLIKRDTALPPKF